jgi:hypothetical protein
MIGLSLKKNAVNTAIDEFEMRAICSRSTREVHMRVAADGGAIYIDLADADWHAVQVTAAGWSIVQSPPVRFRRSAGMQPLPFPERGIPIDRLRPFLNVNANDFTLVVAFLLAALRPSGPYPILALIGEQGTAKTTFVRLLRSLIDPSTVPSSALPFSGRDLFIAAHNAHVQAFENLSKLSNPMSDYLCRLATGGGVRTRTLFRDVDETLLRATRPIMLEGITNYIVRRPDGPRDHPCARTVSRPQDRGRPASRVGKAATGLFGALLDHLVTGLRQLPNTHLTRLPRMADFATWAVACGLDGFEQVYAANRQAAIDVAMEHDVLARAVRALMVESHEWEGTASELLDLLGGVSQIPNAKVLSDELNRLAPMLRSSLRAFRCRRG